MAAVTPSNGISGPRHFPQEFSQNDGDISVQPEFEIAKPKVVRTAPCIVRRVASSVVKSPASSPENSPPGSPRSSGEPWESGIPGLYSVPFTDEDRNRTGCTVISKWIEVCEPEPKETSADRDWLLGPSILKREGSGSRGVNVQFNRCEPMHWWKYPIRYGSDWKPIGPVVSHRAKNDI